MNNNIQALKVLSILLVIIGHSGVLPVNIWIPVTLGLLSFSFTSAYFTYQRYNFDYSIKLFWKNKLKRLGVKLGVINLFLLILFVFEGRDGIFCIHTLINVLGFNGFLNWLRVPNESPFGAGMWFFTLLLVFYAIYPALERINRKKVTSVIFTSLTVTILFVLNLKINYGHALWLTAAGFPIGLFFSKYEVFVNYKYSIPLFFIALLIAGLLNYYFHSNTFNFYLLLLMAYFLISTFFSIKIQFIHVFTIPLSSCILEMYLLHPYLFFKITGQKVIDFLFSIFCIIIVSKILEKIGIFALNFFDLKRNAIPSEPATKSS